MTSPRRDEKRSVKFSRSAKMRVYNFDLTEAERSACWYSEEEYSSFKADVKTTLELITQNPEIDETILCRRGVACKLPENLKTKILNRMKVWGAVFDEQDRQGADGQYDVDAISFASMRHSYSCKRTANMIGMCDEKAARALNSQSQVSPVVLSVENYDKIVSQKGNMCSRPSRAQNIILSPGRRVSSAIAA